LLFVSPGSPRVLPVQRYEGESRSRTMREKTSPHGLVFPKASLVEVNPGNVGRAEAQCDTLLPRSPSPVPCLPPSFIGRVLLNDKQREEHNLLENPFP